VSQSLLYSDAPLARATLLVTPTAVAHVRGDCMKSVHGSFLANMDADLRAALHEPGLTLKPFTVSTLVPTFDPDRFERQMTPGQTYAWRVTSLVPALSQVIHGMTVAATVEVDRQDFRVLHADKPSEPTTTFQATSYVCLLNDALPAERITLRFVSPTAFKSGDVNVPFPLPDSVFGGYLDAWRAYADVELGIDAGMFRQYCRDRVVAESHQLRTRSAWFDHPIPGGGNRARRPLRFAGFVGVCTYRILDRDDDHRRLLNALAAFAEYCGTGSKKSQGAGQTRFVLQSLRS